jgi:hypothetical protein
MPSAILRPSESRLYLAESFLIGRVVVVAQQRVHGHVIIHGVPVPEAVDCVGRDPEPMPSIGLLQGFPWLPVDRYAYGTRGEQGAVWPLEGEPVTGQGRA